MLHVAREGAQINSDFPVTPLRSHGVCNYISAIPEPEAPPPRNPKICPSAASRQEPSSLEEVWKKNTTKKTPQHIPPPKKKEKKRRGAPNQAQNQPKPTTEKPNKKKTFITSAFFPS